ncbi:hypothetical protein [Burkholderia cenocepacia]|uniref:hypothetical protein n=1 Tax=Burkholderia cenocepacia TaxID=95486 RepID=UPI000761196C|nr:hypothetical protein [Burkholderia cenocepacia]KWU19034.1 hypothetical protein AS149_12360 [Burkholderia cenocepacia]
MHDFFYRLEGLSLIPGNKSSGFSVAVSTEALKALSKMTVSDKDYQRLLSRMSERLERANLLPDILRQESGVALLDDTACPRFFTTDPTLGGSLGANPEELGWLRTKENAEKWLGSSVSFTPHNVDTPAQALSLVILVETWGEWAYDKLQDADSEAHMQGDGAS